MSECWLRLIPAAPQYVPPCTLLPTAETWLRDLFPGAAEVRSEVSDRIQFVDCGGNWMGVRCPACGNDLEDWWIERVDEADALAFADLTVRTPSCGQMRTPNDFDFPWTVGFARYRLAARDPNADSFGSHTLTDFERLLDCRLRVIWAHY
jgi:hypothetical protein